MRRILIFDCAANCKIRKKREVHTVNIGYWYEGQWEEKLVTGSTVLLCTLSRMPEYEVLTTINFLVLSFTPSCHFWTIVGDILPSFLSNALTSVAYGFFSILPVINWYRYFVFSCNTPSVWNRFSVRKRRRRKIISSCWRRINFLNL